VLARLGLIHTKLMSNDHRAVDLSNSNSRSHDKLELKLKIITHIPQLAILMCGWRGGGVPSRRAPSSYAVARAFHGRRASCCARWSLNSVRTVEVRRTRNAPSAGARLETLRRSCWLRDDSARFSRATCGGRGSLHVLAPDGAAACCCTLRTCGRRVRHSRTCAGALLAWQ
jgi:hypothetical protein